MKTKPIWLLIAAGLHTWPMKRRRTRLRATTEGRCFYCGGPTFDRYHPPARDWLLPGPGFELVREHKTPTIRGGTDAPENTAASCSRCNGEKGSLTADEFRLRQGFRRKDLSFRFALEPARPQRDWLVVHSEQFERDLMLASMPSAAVVYAARRYGKFSPRNRGVG